MVAITKEVGHGNISLTPWSAFVDVSEDVPELRWPTSINYYDKMRNDAQIASLLLAYFLPIRRYQWYIDPNGARDEVVELVARDLNLPIEGEDEQPQGRRRDRFSHDRHLFHALLAKVYGSMYFEQVYRYYDGDTRAHLRKLAPRMPATISEISAEKDGGLEYIRQWPPGWSTGALTLGDLQSPVIKVDRLVAYVSDQEGGNWYGRSMLRACFRPWLLKDRLLRVDAINHERNGAGVPIAYAPVGASQAQMVELARLAQSYKAGESSGGALPAGADLKFKGVEGSIPDTLASIRYHDEELAARFLAQFTKLGTTQTGSRAVGDTLSELFYLGQTSVAKEYQDTTNEHVIEDLVDINWGIDENAPLLKFSTDADKHMAIADLCMAIDKGAVTADSDLEDYVRAEYNLPERSEDAPIKVLEPEPAAEVVPVAASQRVEAATRREPFEHESHVNFDELEAIFNDAVQTLVAEWKVQVKPVQVAELVAAIEAASGDLSALAGVQATPAGQAVLSAALVDMAERSARVAAGEAAAQGFTLGVPTREALEGALASRVEALDMLMARSISEAAGRKALNEAGGALTSSEIASHVRDHLDSLTDAYLNDQLGGALMQAQNSARRMVFQEAQGGRVMSSELLDPATCAACASVDGHEYESMDDAERDYPSGGFRSCLGGPRCRGTLILVSDAEQAPAVF